MIQVIDGMIWWVGASTLVVGGVGALSALLIWATNQTIELMGFTRTLTQIYGRYLMEQKARKAMPA